MPYLFYRSAEVIIHRSEVTEADSINWPPAFPWLRRRFSNRPRCFSTSTHGALTMKVFLPKRRLLYLLVLALFAIVTISQLPSGDTKDYVNDKIYYALEETQKTFQRTRDPTSNSSRDIGILTVIDESVKERDYFFALESMHCYASLQRYDFRVEKDSIAWRDRCNHTDIMFRRHCIVAHLLDRHEWTLVIDADIGVVNPEKFIESWVDDRFDVSMYDRFFDWEVATGSYLVRRSPFAKSFLHQLADYEYKLPKSFHGSDNGAVHAVLVEILAPSARKELKGCFSIWEKSTSYSHIFEFEACTRLILGSIHDFPPRLKIHGKGTGWVRDGWLTDSLWSYETDFMLHGWQLRRLLTPFSNETRHLQFASWETPFSRPLNQSECTQGVATWYYNKALIRNKRVVQTKLDEVRRKVILDFWKATGVVAKYFS
uniref:Glycosyltransferase family 77 protein n=1 Tax=Steinernema glaseri TaxID=37863 RepID=A0A1I8A2P0_9BILA